MKLLFIVLIFQFLLFPVTGVFAEEHSGHAEYEADQYQCSMHPWIVSDKPGNCPICGMKLTKVHQETAKRDLIKGRSTVEISPERRQLIGITKGKVQKRPLVYSVHSVGHVAYNADIVTALSEYRDAYAAARKSLLAPAGPAKEKAMALMEIAEMKLRLAGLSSGQMDQTKTDDFAASILKNSFVPRSLILPEDSVWVDTDLYESDSMLVKPDDKVFISSPILPGQIFEGIVRTVDPVLNEYPRKLRVRIEAAHRNFLKEGMAVDLQVKVDLGEKISIPETALLESGQSQIVFVDQNDGSIAPRQVRAGQHADEYYEIISGLSEGETVITSAAFLIDSESRLRAAAQSFAKTSLAEAMPAVEHQNKHG